MSGLFDASHSTISSMIENHRRTRSRRVALEQRGWLGRSLLSFPLLIVSRWRERQALSTHVAGVPSTAEEAHLKLIHLMATMIADQVPGKLTEVATAVDTLRPYQDSLICRLRK